VRLATWNVNSLKARLPRVQEWLEYARPDVLCLQETKLADASFPHLAFASLGYEAAHHGNGRWNGVAILSRVGLEQVTPSFAGEPDLDEGRIVSATCGGVRVSSVYVPNGRAVGSEHYRAKLEWMGKLASHLRSACHPGDLLALCGDFNVAPEDRDVWDIAEFEGATHVSEPERRALADMLEWGLEDAFRRLYPQPELFTWWDYRAGNFHKHKGMRIDLILATRPLAERARFGLIDRNARKGKQPSDHAPLFVDFDL